MKTALWEPAIQPILSNSLLLSFWLEYTPSPTSLPGHHIVDMMPRFMARLSGILLWPPRSVSLLTFSHTSYTPPLCAVLCHSKSYPTLCDLMDCSPPGSSVRGDSPGKNTGVGCHALLQGIFPTQRSNPGFPLCRRILYQLSHQGNPYTFTYCNSHFTSTSVFLARF